MTPTSYYRFKLEEGSDKAWQEAIRVCDDFIKNNPDYGIRVIFAVLDDRILAAGEETLKEIVG